MSVIKPRRIPLPLLHTVQFDEFLIKTSTTYNEVLVWLSRFERLKSEKEANLGPFKNTSHLILSTKLLYIGNYFQGPPTFLMCYCMTKV